MKKLFALVLLFGLIIFTAVGFKDRLDQKTNQVKKKTLNKEQRIRAKNEAYEKSFRDRLTTKASEALAYAQKNGLDTGHAFLIDFSLHSGKDRLFVWDFKTDTIAFSSLCAHGVGKDNNKSSYTTIRFSNAEGSYLSSLGKYKTGIRSYSNWGINVHYKLHGLEKTNNNAFKRIVVLHSYALVPKEEIYPRHLPLGYSLGCPVVDDDAMRKIDNMMKEKKKDVLLWIYNQ